MSVPIDRQDYSGGFDPYQPLAMSGKKYYYKDEYTKIKAHKLALAQARAIHANGGK